MQKIFLLTHDTQIDRRIYFFGDYFGEKGCEVTLFPGYNFNECEDKEYVQRPYAVKAVKSYGISVEELPENYKTIITELIRLQEHYFSKNGKYASSLSKLHYRNHNKSITIKFLANNEFYIITLKDQFGRAEYMNTVNKANLLLYQGITVHELKQFSGCERRVLNAMQNPMENNLCFQEGNFRGYRKADAAGEEKIRVFYENQFAFEFNSFQGIAEYLFPMVYRKGNNIEDDALREEYYDFANIIYDFMPIWLKIKETIALEGPPDIVYVADLPTLPMGIKLKEKYGCRLMIDCHEWWKGQSVLWEPDNKEKIALIDRYEKKLYAQCDFRITVGKLLAAKLSDYFNCKFGAIYSCVNDELIPVQKEKYYIRKKLGLSASTGIVIFQGSLTTLRNLDNLARSTKYFANDIYLIICGGGSYENEFKSILSTQGAPEKVIFAGWIAQDELMDYTLEADLGILTYCAVNEYFSMSVPNKLIEYFNAKLPFLYDGSMTEIKEIAEKCGVGCAVDFRSPQAIGEAVNHFIGNHSQREQMKKNYLNYSELFSQEHQSEELYRILGDITEPEGN